MPTALLSHPVDMRTSTPRVRSASITSIWRCIVSAPGCGLKSCVQGCGSPGTVCVGCGVSVNVSARPSQVPTSRIGCENGSPRAPPPAGNWLISTPLTSIPPQVAQSINAYEKQAKNRPPVATRGALSSYLVAAGPLLPAPSKPRPAASRPKPTTAELVRAPRSRTAGTTSNRSPTVDQVCGYLNYTRAG